MRLRPSGSLDRGSNLPDRARRCMGESKLGADVFEDDSRNSARNSPGGVFPLYQDQVNSTVISAISEGEIDASVVGSPCPHPSPAGVLSQVVFKVSVNSESSRRSLETRIRCGNRECSASEAHTRAWTSATAIYPTPGNESTNHPLIA